jgi:(p)ppGpp synthase/HD superfamily hydrolase
MAEHVAQGIAMNNDLVKLSQAADFAARQHVGQRRKGDSAEPYINHLTEVAALLAEATDGSDSVLVMGGLLHDTLEDTDARYDDLVVRFGVDVAALVQEVTDDKSLPKPVRQQMQIDKTPSKSTWAKLLKLADKTSNLRSLISSPPSGWTAERQRDYVVWAAQVVQSCRGLNPRLEAQFDEAYAVARRKFDA